MRGLAVFISDIRNCEWRLRRGGAWAWAGLAFAMGRCPVGPGLLSLDRFLNILLFSLSPAAGCSERFCLTKWRRALGAVGEAARREGSLRLLAVCLGWFVRFGWVGWGISLPPSPPRRCGGALGVVVAALAKGGAERLVAPVVVVYKALKRSRCVFGVRVGLWWATERRLWSLSKSVNGFQFKMSLMESRSL